jgi:hypothetical protein
MGRNMTSKDTLSEIPPEAAAMQLLFRLGTGYMASAALQVALKLEIADRFSSDPMPVSDLARAAGVDEDALYRVLRALASLGLFEEPAPRMFALTFAGGMLRKGPGSFHDMGLWITSPFHFRVYAEMMHAVTTGKPAAEKVVGMPVFEYLAGNKQLSEIFNNAMTGLSAGVAPAALEAYDFSGIDLLVDVAGGHGMVLSTILRHYPAMRGVLFDLPHVIAGSGPVIEAAGVKDRCTTSSGDFFKEVPPGGDAYIMKHIIHDWDDSQAAAILRNIRRELDGRPNGKVILLESVLQPGSQPDLGKLIDLEMLMMPGGRERTEAEFAALFASAGFELVRVVPTRSPLSVVEARAR